MPATTNDNGTTTTTTTTTIPAPAKPRAPRPAGKAPGRPATGKAPKGSKEVSPRKATGPADRAKTARAAANLLKQVSDATRLQVLLTLENGERNVGELCSDLGQMSQPAISHHLALLRHGRLIEPRRNGKNNIYSLTDTGRVLVAAVKGFVGA
jgi:DNA-binding transcriptional ArsR family regulator